MEALRSPFLEIHPRNIATVFGPASIPFDYQIPDKNSDIAFKPGKPDCKDRVSITRKGVRTKII